jgi:NADPH-dependent 2,4-dienoyl-CoA reductase/sulfur reductase-like enzyme/peroxiredoxin family protein/TusA-related sulfurtransferase/rhodanese-related sulfurtransferase
MQGIQTGAAMSKKIVIIGGVAGGASTAARLRRQDETAEIVLLERGEYISYANCGLPYHVGDVIQDRDALLLQTPEKMKGRFNVDVRTGNEVTAIDRAKKEVTIRRAADGSVYQENYDKLVISTGSAPLRPGIPGIESDKIKTLWTIPDTDEIRRRIQTENIRETVVIGGGFIGLEMAENLMAAGCQVTLVEMLNQVMAPLDYEMAQLIHEHLITSGVNLILEDGVSAFEESGDSVLVRLKSGTELSAQLVLLSIGVRPNSQLAKDAGLALNERGGILVDETLHTNDPDIFAIGDVIEVKDFVSGEGAMIPLAGPANKQGRICADNIDGKAVPFRGTQGTSVAKIFDLTAASTGANEKSLKRRGMAKGTDYEVVYVNQNHHAGYYPGAAPMFIKLIFAKDGSRIFGAQIVGRDGVDKRIDVLATALRLGATVRDLTELELAYAPPYSSAKDPVNMAGFTAENVINGLVRFCDWDYIENADRDSIILLDVREDMERLAYSIPGSLNIPLGTLRERLSEIDRTKTVIPFCAIGVRSYNATRILMENGFENVLLYPAGTQFFRGTHYKEELMDLNFDGPQGVFSTVAQDSAGTGETVMAGQSFRLNCSGLQCPGPIMKVFESIKNLNDGDVVEVIASDPGFTRDIVAWCKQTGNTLLSTGKSGKEYVASIRKGVAPGSILAQASQAGFAATGGDNKTIIVFSGDLDKVLASFIIANGAMAMGKKVTMFFTFWGLNVLRKANKVPVKKSFIEAMFGGMMPRGAGKLKLSKMNMGGMGTLMMKYVMKSKNVDSLETLIRKAQDAGVNIIACTMSMDIMGIKEDELIDGIDYAGVGTYLGESEEANLNLFI